MKINSIDSIKNSFCHLGLAFGAVLMIVGCNKVPNEDLGQGKVTCFNVVANVSTRATEPAIAPSRYIMEVYEDTIAQGTPYRHLEQVNGQFEVILKDETNYVCLFWADYQAVNENNRAGGYDASDLKAVSIDGQAIKMAFAGQSKFCTKVDQESTFTKVVLRNAVAKVNYIQTEPFLGDDNTLVVKFPERYTLNVNDMVVTPIGGTVSHTFVQIGQGEADREFARSYVFAQSDQKTYADLILYFNFEPQKIVTRIPLQCNYTTNLKGKFTDQTSPKLSQLETASAPTSTPTSAIDMVYDFQVAR